MATETSSPKATKVESVQLLTIEVRDEAGSPFTSGNLQ